MNDEITVEIGLSTERFGRLAALGRSVTGPAFAGLLVHPGVRKTFEAMVESAIRAQEEFAKSEAQLREVLRSAGPMPRLHWFGILPEPRVRTARRRRVATQMRRTQRRTDRRTRRANEAWAAQMRCPIEGRPCDTPLLAAGGATLGGECGGCGWRWGTWA